MRILQTLALMMVDELKQKINLTTKQVTISALNDYKANDTLIKKTNMANVLLSKQTNIETNSSARRSFANLSSIDTASKKTLTEFDSSLNSVNFSNNINKMNNNLDKIEIPLPARPTTARSLPAKSEQDQIITNLSNKLNSSQLESTDGGLTLMIKAKNPSCPNIPPEKLNENVPINSIKKQPKQQINYDSNQDQLQIKSSNSNNNHNNIKHKTNLDFFIDYSSSIFTTKFEMIGNYEQDTAKKLPPTPSTQSSLSNKMKSSNLSLQKRRNETSASNNNLTRVTRSQSISNMTDKDNSKIIIENIVSPNQVKPYTSNIQSASTISQEEPMSEDDSKNSVDYLNNKLTSYLTSSTSNSKNFLRLTDHLYAGNIYSARNERKMCKLNIEYIIDLTNMRPDDQNRNSMGKLPCLCSKQHSRLYLTIEITETSFKELFNAFSEINKFIQKARKSTHARKVLIFGKETFSAIVICACTQYLMVEYEMSVKEAFDLIIAASSNKNSVKLDNNYIDYLIKFENYLKHMSNVIHGNNHLIKYNQNSTSSSKHCELYKNKNNLNESYQKDSSVINNQINSSDYTNEIGDFVEKGLFKDSSNGYNKAPFKFSKLNLFDDSLVENNNDKQIKNFNENVKYNSTSVKNNSNNNGSSLNLKTAWM